MTTDNPIRELDQIRQDCARKLRVVQVSDHFHAILGQTGRKQKGTRHINGGEVLHPYVWFLKSPVNHKDRRRIGPSGETSTRLAMLMRGIDEHVQESDAVNMPSR